jgi:hypothetical protein
MFQDVENVSLGVSADLRHEDDRFMQRRVGRVVAVFTLAGGASPSPTAEKPTRAHNFKRAISDFRWLC